MDRCPACGTIMLDQANYCSQCGKVLDPATAGPHAPKPKWYYNVWFTLIMLFTVLGPFGLPLVWKNPHFSRGIKVTLTLVMLVYTAFLIELTLRTVRAMTEEVNRLNSTLSF